MKKRIIAVVLIVGILLAMTGFYWFGYLTFDDYVPSFTLSPSTTRSNASADLKEPPRLIVDNIRGRLNKISADIKNTGDQDATAVTWSISVKGGIFKRIDLRTTGSIDLLSQQSGMTIISDRIPFGLGRLDITVTVEASNGDPVTQTAQGFKFFFLVLFVRM
jgi:hypothetical protein